MQALPQEGRRCEVSVFLSFSPQPRRPGEGANAEVPPAHPITLGNPHRQQGRKHLRTHRCFCVCAPTGAPRGLALVLWGPDCPSSASTPAGNTSWGLRTLVSCRRETPPGNSEIVSLLFSPSGRSCLCVRPITNFLLRLGSCPEPGHPNRGFGGDPGGPGGAQEGPECDDGRRTQRPQHQVSPDLLPSHLSLCLPSNCEVETLNESLLSTRFARVPAGPILKGRERS